MWLPAASKHLRVLEGAGLVRRTVTGRRHVCRLDPGPLAGADGWLRFYERYWSEQLDGIEVKDLNAIVVGLRDRGFGTVGEVCDYGNIYRLC